MTVVLAGYWEVSFGTGFVHVPSVPSVDRMRVCAGPAARVQAVRVVQGAARPYNTPRSQPQTGSGEGIGIVQSVCELSLSFKGKGRAASVRDGSSLNPRANATSGG